MTTSGVQTHDFLVRLKKAEESLPPLLLELSVVMQRMIAEIERPQLQDIQALQAELRRMIGDPQNLRDICGTEGQLCGQCPFGAYLPFRLPLCFGAPGPVPALDRYRAPPAYRHL